jgi:hypothetical protein
MEQLLRISAIIKYKQKKSGDGSESVNRQVPNQTSHYTRMANRMGSLGVAALPINFIHQSFRPLSVLHRHQHNFNLVAFPDFIFIVNILPHNKITYMPDYQSNT